MNVHGASDMKMACYGVLNNGTNEMRWYTNLNKRVGLGANWVLTCLHDALMAIPESKRAMTLRIQADNTVKEVSLQGASEPTCLALH
jgi:hypothetical protein